MGNNEYLGLCANCIHAPECAFRQRHDGPILFCEEFFYEKNEVKRSHSSVSVSSAVKNDGQKLDSNSDDYQGLCKNCKQQKNCLLPGKKSGIWFCEEYE